MRCGREKVESTSLNSLKWLWQDLDLFYDNELKSTKDHNDNRKTMEDNGIFKFLVG